MHEYQQLSIEEDELIHQQPRLWPRRSLVIALYLSFFVCLAALWFTGTLLGGADKLLPSSLLQVIVNHRVIALAIPFACLTACYVTLRRLTGEIMAVPKRYLDERQKAMRDQAHHSAFSIIKLSCLVIPALLLAQYLPWFHQSPAPSSPLSFFTLVTVDPSTHAYKSVPINRVNIALLQVDIHTVQPLAQASLPPANPTEIAFAVAILLLCLFLLFSALPMSVLAWKGKV